MIRLKVKKFISNYLIIRFKFIIIVNQDGGGIFQFSGIGPKSLTIYR
jgi:hypothetical protein